MKTEMKTLLFGLLFAVSLGLKAQEKTKHYATVRVTELSSTIVGGGLSSKIYILYDDGTREVVELAKYKDATFADNTDKINQMINKMSSKGYSLVNSTMSFYDAQIITLFVFKKND